MYYYCYIIIIINIYYLLYPIHDFIINNSRKLYYCIYESLPETIKTFTGNNIISFVNYIVEGCYKTFKIFSDHFCRISVKVQQLSERMTYLDVYNLCPVHEHNHTRILVPEVLCSLIGPETQNVPSVQSIQPIQPIQFNSIQVNKVSSFFLN